MRYYTFVHKGNKTMCVSKYAGHEVLGVARRSPADSDRKEFGEKIAQLRCDYKIAKKRAALHAKAISECEQEMARLVRKMNRHVSIYNEAMQQKYRTEKELNTQGVHL